jgi:hypothetical protein
MNNVASAPSDLTAHALAPSYSVITTGVVATSELP